LSSCLDGVSDVAVGPETTLDHRCHGLGSLLTCLVLEGGGFGSWDDGALARARSERCRELELSACCAVVASSSAFSCWCTRRSSEVVSSVQPHGSMAAAARFWDARRKSGGASAFASAFAPPLARRM
jgi:hypothetical protein